MGTHGDTALLLKWFSGFNTLLTVDSIFSGVFDGSVGSC